jgi:hypothetical protein
MSAQNAEEIQAARGDETHWIIDRKYEGRSSFTVQEAAEILGISCWSAWQAAKKGELPTISIGRRKIVPRHRLERLMNGA